MIYLIDDNRREQQKEYDCDFLTANDFSSFLTVIYKISVGTDLSHFKNATCILIHNSFPDFNAAGEVITAKTAIYESILSIAGQNNVPVVIFTNSILDLDYNKGDATGLIRINKRLFYTNLKDYLSYYKETGKSELKILTFGKNFIAQDLSSLSSKISALISTYDIKDKLHEIKTLAIDFADLAKSSTGVMAKFEAMSNGALPQSFLNYLEKIIQSILRHGRNIYN